MNDLREVEQFLFHEARCLDDRARWKEWLDLFTDDGTYWIPYSREQTDFVDTPSIVYEDRVLLALRIERTLHPHAWSQDPETRTARIVGNVMLDGGDSASGDLLVRSSFIMLEYRADRYLQYGGSCLHRLAHVGGELRIRQKRVDLISGDGVYEDIIQILP